MDSKKIYIRLLKLLKGIENYILKLIEVLDNKINIGEEKKFYSDLMPKDEVEKVKTYHGALNWAIYDNNKIVNIALSGPYGAGKSTIINSYIKSARLKNKKILRISLATFAENNEKCGGKEDINKQQLIEKSILEQMIYKVDGKKTPFSRFKKIDKIYKRTIWRNLIIWLIFLTSGWLTYHSSTIKEIQDVFIKPGGLIAFLKDKWLTTITIALFTFTLIILLYEFTKLILKSFKIAKIKFDKVEIEPGKDNNESIYNKYLDEILYFFEETEYEIVIFEDLDRFDNSSIFTNLREVNNFLNNYEKIRRRIIFLYAIKDDMFSDKERTKFFDFIIPVIPFVDAFNSRQIVLNKFKDMKSSNIKIPSESLIKDITIFLDDMRMLVNIINEYIVYYQQINNDDIDADKLFSIIVYKNKMPQDFSELQYNNGVIMKIFDKKQAIVAQEIEILDEKIKKIKNYIELSGSLIINSVDDLQAVFTNRWKKRGVSHIYTNVSNSSRAINIITDNIVQMKSEFNAKSYIRALRDGNNYGDTYTYDDLFTAFGAYENFFTLAEAVELKNKEIMQRKKEELNEYLNIRNELRFVALKDLIQKHNHNEIFEDIKNEELLVFLIREGHIDEDYRHYISHFYPGAISQEEMKFLRSVKNQAELNYDYELNNIEEIIKDISAEEFKSKSVLNNRLLNYIFDNIVTERARFNIILDSLIKEVDSRIDFIDQFCEGSKYDELLINEVCMRYPGFWDFIITKSNFTDEKISTYFKRIINACDEGIIIAMDMCGNVKNYIENTAGIFQIDFRVDVEEKFKNILRGLDIKITSLRRPKVTYSIDNQELEHKFIIYILENAMFKMSESMTRYLYGYLVDFTVKKMQLFDTKNYSSIKMLDNKNFTEFIENNLSDYLSEVFLKLPGNNKEELKEIVNLLGVPEVDIAIKTKIIEKSDVIITDLKVISSELWDDIIECGKWEITWYNVACYFEKFETLSELILEQLNKTEIYEKLSASYIDEVEGIVAFSQDVLVKLYQYLYESNSLTDQCLTKIQNSITDWYNYSESNKLSSKRMQLLLENNCVEFIPKNFIYLKNNFRELYYDWSIRNFDKLLEQSSNISLELTEIKKYLADSKISKSNKINFINAFADYIKLNIENNELRELIYKLKDEATINNLDVQIFEKLISLEYNFDDKLILLANRVKNLSPDEIRTYLRAIGEPISMLSERSNVEGEISIPKRTKSIKRLLKSLVDCKYIQDYKENSIGYEIAYSEAD